MNRRTRPHRAALTRWALLGALAALAAFVAPAPCAAQPYSSGQQAKWELSGFERRLVQKTLDTRGLELLNPGEAEGLEIEEILVESEEVFTPEDLWPDWLNIFHATSRSPVVRQSILLEPGDRYNQVLIDQSARNLRQLPLTLAVALILPVRGRDSPPGTVKLLAITKDVWSLRPNASFEYVDGTFTYLTASISETNLAGRHMQAALRATLEQGALSVSERYINQRLMGERLALEERFAVVFNRDNFDYEGIEADVDLSQPLYSLRDRWSWRLKLDAHHRIERDLIGPDVRTFDDPATPMIEELPHAWRSREVLAEASVTRSFGFAFKVNLTLGHAVQIQRNRFGVTEQERDAYAPELVEAFERDVLARSEVSSSPFVGLDLFTTDFVALRNINTYALAEDFRLGPRFTTRFSHSERLLGASASFERIVNSFTWRWLLLDRVEDPSRRGDLLSLSLSQATRYQDASFQDNTLTASLRNVSPVLASGRLVNRLLATYRFNDLTNVRDVLGGDSGLRGYAAGEFQGRSRLSVNTEWRTLPIEFYTFHLGLVVYYDVGGVADEEDLSDLAVYHTPGVGFRLLNPSSNRTVFRGDWGFPLNPPVGGVFPGSASFGFEQAF